MVLAYMISVLLMILAPVALAVALRRTWPTPWLLFCLGSLTFIVSQVVHLPLNNLLTEIGWLPSQKDMLQMTMLGGQAGSQFPLWRTALILGLTAGLCEELARAAGYAFLQKFKPAWMRVQDSLMLGLGHGGIESMIIGGVLTAATVSMLLSLRGVDLSALNIKPKPTPEQIAYFQLQLQMFTSSPLDAFLPLIERLLAISAHVTFSLMVWRAFARGRLWREWFYILLAILYHAAVDFMAVYASTEFQGRSVLALLSFAVVLIPGWAWAIWTVRTFRPPRSQAASQAIGALDGSLRSELEVFWTALIKELRQLWRTKRLLVMAAVFLIFGMGSPLLAKLTPQLLGSIEGAEMFKDLIPTPTGGDAMTQYIKNISQFGFILAILLGMGAVVGEKERGIVPMIISKPMPRWAFISSKFSAQFLMYLGGFVLAGLGAYYYTLVLFGGLDPRGFALLNLLMLLWLLTFVALSLLGSTLGSSTIAAGGIGLGLSVVLLLAGNLPMYGNLLPGGLLGWATVAGQAAAGVQKAAETAGAIELQNIALGGSAAAAIVLIVFTLILSIGIFEQQEL